MGFSGRVPALRLTACNACSRLGGLGIALAQLMVLRRKLELVGRHCGKSDVVPAQEAQGSDGVLVWAFRALRLCCRRRPI